MYILSLPDLKIIQSESESDVITDLAFCPLSENVCVTSTGDGQIVVRDHEQRLRTTFKGHDMEVSSVQCMHDYILTASWDGSVKAVTFFSFFKRTKMFKNRII